MDISSLKRPIYPMPDYVEKALLEWGLMREYQTRPPYQRNDYIGWITRAKREETRQKRLDQMLSELEAGESYMGMKYNRFGIPCLLKLSQSYVYAIMLKMEYYVYLK